MTTIPTTQELIEELTHESIHIRDGQCDDEFHSALLIKAAQRLRELDKPDCEWTNDDKCVDNYISPKIQNYYKVWQHREAQLEAAKNQWILVSKRLPKEGDCGWTFDVDQGMYDTGCGQAWIFSEGLTLAENKVKFCPFCSGAVREKYER
jgi:hypothetical protein